MFPLLECNICLFHSTELINSYDSLFGIILVSQNQTIKSVMVQTKHEQHASTTLTRRKKMFSLGIVTEGKINILTQNKAEP